LAGLNARDFLGERAPRVEWVRPGVVASALANVALGATLTWWAVRNLASVPPLLAGWVGMAGLILLLHFGAFRLIAWVWCRAGVNAPPIMQAPIGATSVAEFWGGRWNIAFAETARRSIFRPLARRVGTKAAGATVFLISGVIHESVISLPAGGGWGGPRFISRCKPRAAPRKKAWPAGDSVSARAGAGGSGPWASRPRRCPCCFMRRLSGA